MTRKLLQRTCLCGLAARADSPAGPVPFIRFRLSAQELFSGPEPRFVLVNLIFFAGLDLADLEGYRFAAEAC